MDDNQSVPFFLSPCDCYAGSTTVDGYLRRDEGTRGRHPTSGREGGRLARTVAPTGIAPLALGGEQDVMNRWPGLVPDALPIEIRQRVAAVCERFENAWHGGERPTIELYLEGLGPVERTAALHGLVALESRLRCEEDDPPTLMEYVHRFPGDATVVTTAVATSNRDPAFDAPVNGIDQRGRRGNRFCGGGFKHR